MGLAEKSFASGASGLARGEDQAAAVVSSSAVAAAAATFLVGLSTAQFEEEESARARAGTGVVRSTNGSGGDKPVSRTVPRRVR